MFAQKPIDVSADSLMHGSLLSTPKGAMAISTNLSARFLLRPAATPAGGPPPDFSPIGEKPAGGLFLFAAIALVAFLSGCVTTDSATTEYGWTNKGGCSSSLKFPKQLYAEDFKARINSRTGEAEVSAKKIWTGNVETIQAQGARESGNIKAAGNAAPKIGEAIGAGIGAAAKTAIKP
jgi:hypothetical protein